MGRYLEGARKFVVTSKVANLFISLLVAFGVRAIETTFFSNRSFSTPVWFRPFLGFCITSWLFSVVELVRTSPERDLQNKLTLLRKRYGELKEFINIKLLNNFDAFTQEIGQLVARDGEVWDSSSRMRTANDIFDSLSDISTYCATCTDAPIGPTIAARQFFARHRNKLIGKSVKRLLVYPDNTLIRDLNSEIRLKYLDEFIHLHTDNGFDLRYWPHSAKDLERELLNLPRPVLGPLLIDFGIIKNKDSEIVFGQSAASGDTDTVTGRGRIIIDGSQIEAYRMLFDQLWEETKPECYPQAQLSTFNWLCGVRLKRSNDGVTRQSGSTYFAQIINIIKNAHSIRAVDIADDMRVWFQVNEYKKFLDATIHAASAQGANGCSRIYLFRRGLNDVSTASNFINSVIRPQVSAGVKVGIGCFEELVNQNCCVVDCIYNENGEGFYLLPGDSFSENQISEEKNGVDSTQIYVFNQIYNDIETKILPTGWMFSAENEVNEKQSELASWLAQKPKKR